MAEPSLAPREIFALVMAVLERQDLQVRTRANLVNAVLQGIYSASFVESPNTNYHQNRLVIALFRAALTPEGADTRDNILSVYLPNLIGLTGGATRRSAEEVFHDFPGEREKIRQMLAPYAGEAASAKLTAWLQGP
jgi:hypothetical protein